MATFVLDTNVLVDYSRGFGRIIDQVDEWDELGEVLVVTCIQVAEYMAGIEPAKRVRAVDFLNGFVYRPISQSAAAYAGQYRYDFARIGVQLGTPDSILAGVARDLKAVLVTNNRRDFPMRDIEVRSI